MVSGDEWLGDVALVFMKGNTVVQAGTATTGPNGGSISIAVTAPTESGSWQVCASGINRLDGQPMSTCSSFEVTPPAPSPPQTTNSPQSTVNQAPTTTQASNSTTQASNTTTIVSNTTSSVSADISAVESSTSSSVTLERPAVPSEPDGISEVEEETPSTEGSGLSGLTIGLVAGIVAVTGLGIVGLVSSSARHRPRRGTLVGIGLAGAALAGATAIAMPPPALNVPKLSMSRVQVGEGVPKNSTRTITATCPSGTVIIGGGWASDWSSTQVDDVQPLVEWMEKEPGYVIVPPGTLNSFDKFSASDGDGVNPDLYTNVRSEFWDHARTDATVHISDTVWPAPYVSYRSARDQNLWVIRSNADSDAGKPIQPRPEVSNIAWSEEIRQAFVRRYYTTFDRLGTYYVRSRFVGALVSESRPIEQGWRVTITNPKWSLQAMLDVHVVALCAPLAASTNDSGVLGVTLRSKSGPWNVLSTCSSNEVLTSMGFSSPDLGGVASMLPNTGLSGGTFNAMSEKSATLVAVCVRKDGLEVTSASASTTVSGGHDDGTTAVCPSGYTITGGGMDFSYRQLSSSASTAAIAVGTAIPVGSKNFNVVIRSPEIAWPQSPSGTPLLNVGSVTAYAHTDYSKVDSTEMTVHALCAKRVFAPA